MGSAFSLWSCGRSDNLGLRGVPRRFPGNYRVGLNFSSVYPEAARMSTQAMTTAIDAALAGDWARAHEIVQRDETDPTACHIHAVLHKIEGDARNSRYWYARTQHHYEDWADPKAELQAIRTELEAGHG
jgi:hypothetical protein